MDLVGLTMLPLEKCTGTNASVQVESSAYPHIIIQ
jgi:hypothetical protein